MGRSVATLGGVALVFCRSCRALRERNSGGAGMCNTRPIWASSASHRDAEATEARCSRGMRVVEGACGAFRAAARVAGVFPGRAALSRGRIRAARKRTARPMWASSVGHRDVEMVETRYSRGKRVVGVRAELLGPSNVSLGSLPGVPCPRGG